jgi:hypothetical protein
MTEPTENLRAGQSSASTKAGRSAAALRARSAAILELINHCLSLEHPFRVIDAHHLLYLFQVCGEECGLDFEHTLHGPCAEQLELALGELAPTFLTGYRPGQSKLCDSLRLTPKGATALSHFKTRAAAGSASFPPSFQRTLRVIEGFESPYGLELLATIHWLESRESSSMISTGSHVSRTAGQRLSRILRWECIQIVIPRLVRFDLL